MQCDLPTPDALGRVCTELEPIAGIAALNEAINGLNSTAAFRWVLSRGGWHRLGGVLDAEGRRVSDSVSLWLEIACAGDLDALLADYADSGYSVTRMAGKTHFFTLACGERAEQFIQIEIEELQELIERPLIDPDWLPDSIEELLEPLEMRNAQMSPIGRSFYRLRRITAVSELMAEPGGDERHWRDLRRFMRDWQNSSAVGQARFCDHWVLAIREYRGQDGEARHIARPLAVGEADYPCLPVQRELRGLELATALHAYDRAVGYPFAWYFTMLSRKADSYALADAVLADQMGAYEYLARKDLQILREWERHPYSV